jgi:hypothetical protein
MVLRRFRGVGLLAVLAIAGMGIPPAVASSGTAITPAILEHVARVGPVGSVVITNATKGALTMAVVARPWLQSLRGVPTPDADHTLAHYLRLSSTAFRLAAGASRTVKLRLLHNPPGHSLYGNIEVLAKPKKQKKGITLNFRLISSVRLDPPAAKRVIRVKLGAARVVAGAVVLRVLNAGNTVEPINATARISGSRSPTASVPTSRVLPGHAVDMQLSSARGLAKGIHTATIAVTQAGRRVATTKRTFRVG